MVVGNGVENIQAAAYNGARTVYCWGASKLIQMFLPDMCDRNANKENKPHPPLPRPFSKKICLRKRTQNCTLQLWSLKSNKLQGVLFGLGMSTGYPGIKNSRDFEA